MKCLLDLRHTDAYLKAGQEPIRYARQTRRHKNHTPCPSKTTPENDLGRGGSGGGGSFVVRRLDSCGLGLFLGHAFGDEGAVGRGMLVIGWEGGR